MELFACIRSKSYLSNLTYPARFSSLQVRFVEDSEHLNRRFEHLQPGHIRYWIVYADLEAMSTIILAARYRRLSLISGGLIQQVQYSLSHERLWD